MKRTRPTRRPPKRPKTSSPGKRTPASKRHRFGELKIPDDVQVKDTAHSNRDYTHWGWWG